MGSGGNLLTERKHPLVTGKTAVCLALLCLLGTMVGCAHRPMQNPEDALRDRVEKTWQAKVRGDCETVYHSLNAHYRKMVSKDAFALRCLKTRIDSYRLKDVEIAEDATHAVATV